MKNNQIPEVRFPEFKDAWELRKLKEVAVYFNGGSFENDVIEEGKYQLVTLKSVNTSGELTDSGKFINKEVSTLSKNSLVMILSEQAPGLLGMTATIPENNRYVLNQRVAEILPNKCVNSYFLSKSINNNQLYFSKRGAGTKVQNISKPNVENFKLYIPSYEEQKQIGAFFKQLDDTIALHQRKLKALKQTKKGFLQKMFPKEGEKVPEVRFPGFPDNWEKLQLGDVVDKQIKGKAQYEKLKFGSIEYLDTNRLNGGDPILTDGFKDVLETDVLILWDGSKAGTVYTGFEGALGSTLKAYRTSANGQFVYQFLKRQQDNIYSNYRTPNIPHVQKDFLDIFKISVPIDEEQTKIGNFFKQLDDTIALHQRELEILKNTKKAFLQKMFV